MRRAGFAFFLVLTLSALTGAQTGMSRSLPRGTRSFYGSNFGNHYQYLGLGYGYAPGSFGPGAWSAFRGGRGYGGYGGYGYGGSRYGGYGGYGMSNQLENLHEQQMMWSLNFAPMPQTAPGVTVNPFWNPYQSHLGDDIYHRDEPVPEPEKYENPFVQDHPTAGE